jgi:hypothetical protein
MMEPNGAKSGNGTPGKRIGIGIDWSVVISGLFSRLRFVWWCTIADLIVQQTLGT